jgi:hypothetical protein
LALSRDYLFAELALSVVAQNEEVSAAELVLSDQSLRLERHLVGFQFVDPTHQSQDLAFVVGGQQRREFLQVCK